MEKVRNSPLRKDSSSPQLIPVAFGNSQPWNRVRAGKISPWDQLLPKSLEMQKYGMNCSLFHPRFVLCSCACSWFVRNCGVRDGSRLKERRFRGDFGEGIVPREGGEALAQLLQGISGKTHSQNLPKFFVFRIKRLKSLIVP